MARGDYGPEIKNAIGSAPKGKPRVGAQSESASGLAKDVGTVQGGASNPPNPAMPSVKNATMPTSKGTPPDLHKVLAATSIAHAILGGRGGAM